MCDLLSGQAAEGHKERETERERETLLVLPVAFDNQGGLASTQQRGELPLCSVASVQVCCRLLHCRCNVSVIIFKAKSHVVGYVGADRRDRFEPRSPGPRGARPFVPSPLVAARVSGFWGVE